ncbi:hypothetical protein GCM10011410_32760 [Hoyosella rhizosphaerae]|uniref:Uncharacterized protein n=1 Tax=Hoyosella rhizosphaerae TaxID=1755582 RepID=A0A916XKA8_9ACTN|nr:hypothetical protein GCM10011410_32760 [Hoyosella rhizosphaerae]
MFGAGADVVEVVKPCVLKVAGYGVPAKYAVAIDISGSYRPTCGEYGRMLVGFGGETCVEHEVLVLAAGEYLRLRG